MTIELKAEEELDNLEDFQYAIPLPLCILCNDASLLEQALEIYQACYPAAICRRRSFCRLPTATDW